MSPPLCTEGRHNNNTQMTYYVVFTLSVPAIKKRWSYFGLILAAKCCESLVYIYIKGGFNLRVIGGPIGHERVYLYHLSITLQGDE